MATTSYYGFGSPEAYAKAITQKESSGQALSNPTAAAAFKVANPQYFSTATPPGGSSGSYGNNYYGFGSPEAYAGAIQAKEYNGQTLSNPADAARFKAENPQYFNEIKPYDMPEFKAPYGNEITPYNSPYSDDIAQALSAIQNRGAFSYDPSTDKGLATAQDNAMGSVSRAAARRNMVYSDSNKAQMSGAALEQVPVFRSQAFGEYSGENDRLYNMLSQLGALEGTDYGRFRDTVGDKRYANEDAYGQYRGLVGDTRYLDETKYGRKTYADETEYTQGRNAFEDYLATLQMQNSRDDAAANRQQDIDLAKLPYEMGLTPAQQADLDLARDKYNWDTSPSNPGNVADTTKEDAAQAKALTQKTYDAWVQTLMGMKDPVTFLKGNKTAAVKALGADGYTKLLDLVSKDSKLGTSGGGVSDKYTGSNNV